jgi:thioredoxin-like negative regulator of GroEL
MLNALSSFLLAASGTAVAQPQQAQQPPPGTPQTIVVIGDRVADLRRRLAACLARHCPPNEDIDATTALAELLFDNGEYRDARTVLLASIGRNRRQAEHYPEPVSDLYRANALVARHLGFDADAQRSTWEILHSLQRGIPVEDARHFTARLEVIESLIAFGDYVQARHELGVLADRARAAGRDDVVAATELRGLWLEYLQAPESNEIVRALTTLAASPDARRSIGARILLVRIYNARGQTRQADALISTLGGRGTHRQLLFAPDYELAQHDINGIGNASGRIVEMAGSAVPTPTHGLTVDNLADRLTDIYDQLIDVAFRIRPDGTVTDVQIVNRRGAPGWETPVIGSIAGRRYAVSRDGSETYRVERYSYTAERRTQGLTATRISNRSPRGRVEFHELSETNIPAAPHTGSL